MSETPRVFVVTTTDDDRMSAVRGVFSTREGAEACSAALSARLSDDCEIEEFGLDEAWQPGA